MEKESPEKKLITTKTTFILHSYFDDAKTFKSGDFISGQILAFNFRFWTDFDKILI